MDPSTPQHSTRSRRKVPATAIVAVVLGVLTAVMWATGGLRAQSAAPDQARPGSTVNQGLFSVQVVSAQTANMKVGFEDKPVPVLVVRMRVTNNGEDSQVMEGGKSFGLSAGVQLAPAPYRYPDAVRNDPALGAASALQPRLPSSVDTIWKLTGAPPRQATVVLREWEYRLSFEEDEYYWSTLDNPIIAQVTVPVRPGGTG
jgi:hypothetical protein